MNSQIIASMIRTNRDSYDRFAAQHTAQQLRSAQAEFKSAFPDPAIHPRCLELNQELPRLEKQMLWLCPEGCADSPAGWFWNREAVWMPSAWRISTEEQQALTQAISRFTVSDEQQAIGGDIQVDLTLPPVAEEDGGDAFRSRTEALVPTHSVSFSAERADDSGAWVLNFAAVNPVPSKARETA